MTQVKGFRSPRANAWLLFVAVLMIVHVDCALLAWLLRSVGVWQ